MSTTSSPQPPRRQWKPVTGEASPGRQAHAAEHAADCLDRIEQHLATIATSLTTIARVLARKP
jgi:hypothetical protein